ncbi:MAG: dihydrodipicolinate reductase [Desulfobacterales bacterium]
MNRIKVMVNGLPGNMAVCVANNLLNDERFALINHSLTGPEIEQTEFDVYSISVHLVKPDNRDQVIEKIKEAEGPFICVDYTHPTAANGNARFYCKHQLPFVMGTTGGDREKLLETVRQSSVPAVIAPNMAKQIVGFQAMMEYAADTFPNLFAGYHLEIEESHQHGKADTSGTAKAMVGYFNKLGTKFTTDEIIKIRDPEIQKNKLGVPEEHLGGHGWHTYRLTSTDGTVQFSFTHNVNAREIYAQGTLDALAYLHKKVQSGIEGKIFSMIDVLKGI